MMKKNSITNFTTSISKMDNIKIIRLQSGEDIIANYKLDEESGIVEINRPMMLMFKRLPTGKSIMMMGPWLPIELIETNSALLYTQDILTVISPKESLIKYYNNAADETEETLKEYGHNIEMSLTNNNEDDEEEEEDEFDMDEIFEQVKGRIVLH